MNGKSLVHEGVILVEVGTTAWLIIYCTAFFSLLIPPLDNSLFLLGAVKGGWKLVGLMGGREREETESLYCIHHYSFLHFYAWISRMLCFLLKLQYLAVPIVCALRSSFFHQRSANENSENLFSKNSLLSPLFNSFKSRRQK